MTLQYKFVLQQNLKRKIVYLAKKVQLCHRDISIWTEPWVERDKINYCVMFHVDNVRYSLKPVDKIFMHASISVTNDCCGEKAAGQL